MRGSLVLSVLAAAGILATASCARSRQAADDAVAASAAPVASPQSLAPAPSEPDLASVMERFYQQVEGAHWRFAYAMLTPRYRATLSQDALRDRYESVVDPKVSLRQMTGTSVTARLDGADRTDASRSLQLEETVRLAWDGERWAIDDIARRDVRAGTR